MTAVTCELNDLFTNCFGVFSVCEVLGVIIVSNFCVGG